MDEKQAQEYHMLEFNPNDPKSEVCPRSYPLLTCAAARACRAPPGTRSSFKPGFFSFRVQYITEYTPKKGQGRARAPDWVLDARFRPCPPGGNFATSHRADYPPVSGDHRRTK